MLSEVGPLGVLVLGFLGGTLVQMMSTATCDWFWATSQKLQVIYFVAACAGPVCTLEGPSCQGCFLPAPGPGAGEQKSQGTPSSTSACFCLLVTC